MVNVAQTETLEAQLADFVTAATSGELAGYPKLILVTFGSDATGDVARVRERLPPALSSSASLHIAAADRADRSGLLATLNSFANANFQGRYPSDDEAH